jgi:hypothetical protein
MWNPLAPAVTVVKRACQAKRAYMAWNPAKRCRAGYDRRMAGSKTVVTMPTPLIHRTTARTTSVIPVSVCRSLASARQQNRRFDVCRRVFLVSP